MNAKTNYTLVGVFVMLSITLIFIFVIWLVKPTNKEALTEYKIYFTESVSGLNVDAPVKYRGVTVGKVKKMGISPENNEEIEVKVVIDKTTPIKEDTVAKLKAQGITGLSYIDLSKGSADAGLLCDSEKEELVIQSVPSFLVKMEESFGSVSMNLSATLHATSVLLRDENQEAITTSLKHLASLLQKADVAFDAKTVKQFDRLLASANSVTAKIDKKTLPNVDRFVDQSAVFEQRVADALTSVSESYKIISSSMAVFEMRNKRGDYSVKESTEEPMKQFGVTMQEMQQTLVEINQILARYGDSPSDMLLQSEEPNIGPGEQ